jgi:thiosulfate/3-mercaptopyruvate sulfurtransferase
MRLGKAPPTSPTRTPTTTDTERDFRLRDHPLVETEWLAAHLDDPDLRVVDARWRGDGSGLARYRAGHLPGAEHLDWHADLSRLTGRVRDLILPPAAFARRMVEAGIGDHTRVVAYADEDYSGAARLWWALRYYGHDEVALLNGGFDKWVREGRPLSRAGAPPRPARFMPRPRRRLRATAAEIQRALATADPGVRLVDTRPPEQFAGRAVWTPAGSHFLPPDQEWVEVNGRRTRGGRIPGAANLVSSGNLNPNDWTYLAPESLRARAAEAGVRPDQRVITYCGVGVSAALGLFALHVAGFPDLALYDASWEEWGTDPARPVERD